MIGRWFLGIGSGRKPDPGRYVRGTPGILIAACLGLLATLILWLAAAAFLASPDTGYLFHDALSSAPAPLFGLGVFGLFIGLSLAAAATTALWAVLANDRGAATVGGRMAIAAAPAAAIWVLAIQALELIA